MKKIVFLLISFVLYTTLAACGDTSVTTVSSSATDSEETVSKENNTNIEGETT